MSDVVCTSGAGDRPFEERHPAACVAVVVAGSFRYRGAAAASGRRGELMTPGSLLLGGAGQCFECGHEHAAGDRCASFHFAPDYFDRLAFDTGGRPSAGGTFPVPRLPPMRDLSQAVSRVSVALVGGGAAAWEEIAIDLASRAARAASGLTAGGGTVPAGAESRVTRVVREIERSAAARLTLSEMADMARTSPFHFLRVFERVTGVTPH